MAIVSVHKITVFLLNHSAERGLQIIAGLQVFVIVLRTGGWCWNNIPLPYLKWLKFILSIIHSIIDIIEVDFPIYFPMTCAAGNCWASPGRRSASCMRRGYQVCWRRLHQGPSHLYDFVYSVYTKYILYIYFYIIIFLWTGGIQIDNRYVHVTCVYTHVYPPVDIRLRPIKFGLLNWTWGRLSLQRHHWAATQVTERLGAQAAYQEAVKKILPVSSSLGRTWGEIIPMVFPCFVFLNCCFFGSWPQRIKHDQPISTCISLLVLQRICDEILSEAAPGRVICSLQRGGEAMGHGLSRRISYWSGRICEHSAPRRLWKCMVFPMFYSPMQVEKWINKCMNHA